MPTPLVNFSAALAGTLLICSCGPANSSPRSAQGSPAPPAAQTVSTTPINDAVVAAADRGRIKGDDAARTWLIVASDFQCPFCKQWHDETWRPLLDEYVRTGKVKVAYINFPLGQHQNAVVTAEAAMCAGAQNKFFEYHDGLFATQKQWATMPQARPLLDSLARAVGVDLAAWKQCVESGRLRPLIHADRDRAAAAGVKSTPSFIVGNQVLLGAVPIEALRPALDAAIAKDRSENAPR